MLDNGRGKQMVRSNLRVSGTVFDLLSVIDLIAASSTGKATASQIEVLV